ncbi:transcription repressor OFP13-like [Primulina tabacum]|uniref:transcription repressor OFP13-like n=1 Tax=Primulina tabacum TaxID=48773 RepID=UPI003F59D9C6
MKTSQMRKKVKPPFLPKPKEHTTTAAAASPWLWPACVNHPKTLSFRSTTNNGIMNSAYLVDPNKTLEFVDTPADSFFSLTNSFERMNYDPKETSFSFSSEMFNNLEIREGLKSKRLFFKPGETSSILEEAKPNGFQLGESVRIMAMDSRDPFLDFRASMEEMIEAHGLKDWDCFEDLLTCYLRVNLKSNRGYIIGAFVDLLLHLPVSANDHSSNSAIVEHCSPSSNTTQCSLASLLSFSSSS